MLQVFKAQSIQCRDSSKIIVTIFNKSGGASDTTFSNGHLHFCQSSFLVVFIFGRLPFWSSSILVVFHFGRLPFWSSSILVAFHFGRLPLGQVLTNHLHKVCTLIRPILVIFLVRVILLVVVVVVVVPSESKVQTRCFT